ncbi:hypothetical protein BGX34_006682 [Mortierella sp. NVP85]|nr:hypothetical protein BGX34_006682 [Mortierella sp. NVP85]
MSPFPNLVPENARISTVHDGVHDFFNDSDVHPNDWTPPTTPRQTTLVTTQQVSPSCAEVAKLRIIEKIEAQNSVFVANARKYTDAQYITSIYHSKRPRSPEKAGQSSDPTESSDAKKLRLLDEEIRVLKALVSQKDEKRRKILVRLERETKHVRV